MPWESAQEFQAHAIAGYPTMHRVVELFRAVGTSRPVDLTDANEQAFALAVIEAWATEVGEDKLPTGIDDFQAALSRRAGLDGHFAAQLGVVA